MSDELERLTSALADRYAIERELGQGGMATVYLAEDLKLKRKVAIKVLLPDLAGAMGPKRFEREIGIVAQFSHPNILGIHDSGDVDGFLYYVMPFVEGETLRDRLDREKQLPIEDALQIAEEVAAALSYAHDRDVVHRDIKPANILLEDGRAVVADFGIARAISEAGADNLTRTGTSIGTPTYMSPEQAAGSGNIDGRSDVYSLGCVAYEMLAGQPPFMGRSSMSLVAQHITTAPQPVTTFRATVPEGAATAIERALAKSPADRFSPASKFAEALRAESGPLRRGPSSGAPAWRRMALGAGIIVALGMAGTLGRSFLAGPDTAIESRYVIAAELDGSASEEDRGMVRDLLTTALGQSPALRFLPQDAIDRALANAGMADTTRLTEAIAVELAERGRVPAVLTGEVNRLGPAWALSLRIVNPDSGTVVGTLASAQNDSVLIATTLNDAVKELVAGVEVNPAAVGSIRPLEEIMTPSMAALRAYRRYTPEFWMRGDVGPLEEAVAIDSAFAKAWLEMAESFSNGGQLDTADILLRRALSHADRLTDHERLYAEALAAGTKGDYPVAYERHRASWEAMGRGAWGAANVAAALAFLGLFERADSMMPYTYEPFGRNIGAIQNELAGTLALGEAERGRELLSELAEAYPFALPWNEMLYHVAFSEWSQAESVAVLLLEDPTVPDIDKWGPLVVEASALA
ncbi:MAG: serine/threonine protein kinase, partial [Gemmatimonadota bacterium]|nr:serine/threonine protein kinase [Gemmatimonadota bacterium]